MDARGVSAYLRRAGVYAAYMVEIASGDPMKAVRLVETAVPLSRQAGDSLGAVMAMANLADACMSAGLMDDAIRINREIIQMSHHPALQLTRGTVLINLTGALLAKGESAEARTVAIEAWDTVPFTEQQAWAADYLSLLAALEGRLKSAAMLLGYSDACYERKGADRQVNEAAAYDRARALAMAALGEAEVQRLKERGTTLRDEEVAPLAFEQ
jgi:tetratricopeptide (TPR) repeat protein